MERIRRYFVAVFVLALLALEGVHGQCNEGSFGRDCKLVCNCDKSCSDDGTCPTYCTADMAGPTCQIKTMNLAEGQPTAQEPLTKNGQESGLAVDGDMGTRTWVQDQDGDAYNVTAVNWHVDLGASSNITSVVVMFYDAATVGDREKKRRPGFSVFLKNDLTNNDTSACHTDNTVDASTMASKFDLTSCSGEARYVVIENTRTPLQNMSTWSKYANLELAEVQVFVDQGCSKGTYGQSCEKQCGHCSTGTCQRNTGICDGDCMASWYGDQCSSQCSPDCKNSLCDQTGRCTNGCIDNTLIGEFCNESCSYHDSACKTCEVDVGGTFQCLEKFECDKNCMNCSSHVCSECFEGFFLEGQTCTVCNLTDKHCIACSGVFNCTKCSAGYYPSTKNCQKCPENCLECNSMDECTKCKPDWEGPACNCSSSCVKNNKTITEWCSVDSKCVYGCPAGRHGTQCQSKCQGYCAICRQSDGRCENCTHGHYDKFYHCNKKCGPCAANETCSEPNGGCSGCIDGRYSQTCNMSCGTNCEPYVCEQLTGECKSCRKGFYGKTCNMSCGTNCDPHECDKTTGECKSCRKGSYGQACEIECNSQCSEKACDKDSGSCIRGCVAGFHDSYCNQSCPANCLTSCDQYGAVCHSCTDGHFGKDCTSKCSVNCGSNFNGSKKCHQVTGNCEICKVGQYGDTCDHPCSTTCKFASIFGKPICKKDDGRCKGCAAGSYGMFCSMSCSPHCAKGTCSQMDGNCEGGCMSGWYNQTCESTCSEGCKDRQCNRTTAHCLLGCDDGYDGVVCVPIEQGADLTLIIVLIVLALVLIVLIILAVIILRRRSHMKVKKRSPASITLETVNGRDEMTALIRNGSSNAPKPKLPLRDSMRNEDQGDIAIVKSEPSDYYNLSSQIPVGEFSDYLHKRRNEDTDWFKAEFKKLPTGLLKDVNDSIIVSNRGKCRYKNLYPYDWNRVKLDPEPGMNHDFVNASYLKGYKMSGAFIAAQGPTKDTLNDFWRMIFQKDCGRIVMLTNLYEEGKMKCERYWPTDEEPELFGVYEVVLIREDVNPNYTVRYLQATNSQTKEVKDFHQYHYTTWPDRNVPDNPGFILAFRDKVMQDTEGPDGPVLVHCSAGIGRTGTFIALDYLILQAQEEQHIDVFRTVTDMRYQRTNFVQTDIQYGFLHNAICEALTTQEMEISSGEFATYFHSLAENNWEQLHKQFEALQKHTACTDMDGFNAGQLEENLHKNRYPSILPLDMHRAYLSTPVKGSNDYINAVFLPSCMNKTGFLLTQMPLPQTVTDFWRLVYDQHACNIVMLNNLNDSDETIAEYWPLDDSVYGPFRVQLLAVENGDDFNTMHIQLTHRSLSRETVMQINLFQFNDWPEGEATPSSTKSLTSLISQVSRSSKDSRNEPVIVHCMDGAERSGVYSVVSAVLERLQAEQKVNIPHVVLQQRGRRPHILQNFEQYLFVYQAVAEYITDTQIYSNVL